jgi:hypothetical protein
MRLFDYFFAGSQKNNYLHKKFFLIIKNNIFLQWKHYKLEYYFREFLDGKTFDLEKIDKTSKAYMLGHFQKYGHIIKIRETLLKDFAFTRPLPPSIKKIQTQMKETHSVAMHVRRGDYLTLPNFNICTIDYYKNAAEFLKNKYGNLTFFLFSDDINYLQNNFSFLEKYIAVDTSAETNPDYWDLFLMTQSDHNIIANSSYSWWGAFLNQSPGQTVIAPQKWLKDESILTSDLCPPDWIRVCT